MDRKQYPADWEAISAAVRAQAGNRCEWCGAPNGAVGWRDVEGYFWPDRGRGYKPKRPYIAKQTRIVLTVAHLGAPKPGEPPWHGDPHDKMDVRPENLAALCNRCHLGYDADDHRRHAAETRRRRQQQAGQAAFVD